MRRFLAFLPLALLVPTLGCSSAADTDAPASELGASGDAGQTYDTGSFGTSDAPPSRPYDGGPAADTGGSFGGVGTGGAQDFAAFRKALDDGKIPAPSSLDAAGFFAEHFTTLPAPTCGKTFCLHGMTAVAPDRVRGGDWTLLQMGMNSPIDPATVKKPSLDIAVVLDRSGSMSSGDKIGYARTGVKHLVDALGPEDRLTFIIFDSVAETKFGPATVTDKAAVKKIIDGVMPNAGTNLYAGIEAGYKAIEASPEQLQRRVIFLTDGVATEGITDSTKILAMSAGYNKKGLGITTIGLGADVNGTLLRGLSEKGGGNYYFVEKPEAVTEVFTEELAFFVAPIAYDLTLTLSTASPYKTKEVFGSYLWTATSGGGTVEIPSVFLVSRVSTKPGPGGGRRGGGSAIIADLAVPEAITTSSKHEVAKLSLKYRLPGSKEFETQELSVSHDGVPGVAPTGGSFDTDGVKKNEQILAFFVAFRDATKLAAAGDKPGALKLLESFRPKIAAAIPSTDEDLVDDLKILDQYIALLKK